MDFFITIIAEVSIGITGRKEGWEEGSDNNVKSDSIVGFKIAFPSLFDAPFIDCNPFAKSVALKALFFFFHHFPRWFLRH